jgi:hypothetical protein
MTLITGPNTRPHEILGQQTVGSEDLERREALLETDTNAEALAK